MSWIEHESGMVAEAQGAYAPESLNPEGGNDVFSRQFSNGEKVIEVSAAPTIPHEGMCAPLEPWTGEYEVTLITHTRDEGDDGGDTSDYEYTELFDVLMSYERAVQEAEQYIRTLDPERAFSAEVIE